MVLQINIVFHTGTRLLIFIHIHWYHFWIFWTIHVQQFFQFSAIIFSTFVFTSSIKLLFELGKLLRKRILDLILWFINLWAGCFCNSITKAFFFWNLLKLAWDYDFRGNICHSHSLVDLGIVLSWRLW